MFTATIAGLVFLLLLWTVYEGRTMQLVCNYIVKEKVTTEKNNSSGYCIQQKQNAGRRQALIYIFYR
jgi:hypothetical protein